MSKPKFSKRALLDRLQDTRDWYEKEYGFNAGNGWPQVDKCGEEVNRHYGEYNAYRRVIDLLQDWGK